MTGEHWIHRERRTIRNAFNAFLHPQRRTMFRLPKARVDRGECWRLDNVKQRIEAADQLGHDVVMRINDDGDLLMQYQDRVPKYTIPWEVRP